MTAGESRPDSWSADDALEELYAAHWRSLVRTAYLLVHDAETAEDVVQDVFVAMHAHWSSLRDPGKALGYLRRSVVNGSRSVLRRRGVAERYIAHERGSWPGWTESTEDRAVGHHQAVLAALGALPRRQREVVVLRYYVDLSEAETADYLGISRGAVKSHASRGLARLRELLPELRNDGGERDD